MRHMRVVRVGKDPVIQFAAEELRKYLKKAEPTMIIDELVMDHRPEGEGYLTLDTASECCLKSGALRDAKWDDAIRIDVENDEGVIFGSNPRSVLIGVYRFLKELGFAFTRPGIHGERTPMALKKEYRVEVIEQAAHRHRGICIEGADTYQNIADMIDFIPKAGMNEYYIQFWVPSTFFERWYFHKVNPYLEEEKLTRSDVEGFVASFEDEIVKRGICYHKTGHGWTCEPFGIEGTTWDDDRVYNITDEARSYLAEVGGKRELWGNVPLNTNLCYSNPVVREKIANAICEYSENNPRIDVIHFWLADGDNNHCECENCRKKRPSDWYVQMLNEVDAKLTQAGLSTRIVFLIYVDLLWEPMENKLNNPDRFILMFAPITRSYGVNYGDSGEFTGELAPYVRNQLKMPQDLAENMARLKKWQEQFKGDSFVYDYHFQWAHAVDPGYEKAARNMYEDMTYLHNMGLDGNLGCQVDRSFFPSAAGINAQAKALWDPSKTFDEVEDQYYEEVYGKDGKKVREYLALVSDNFHIYNHFSFRDRNVSYEKITNEDKIRAEIASILPVIEKGIMDGGERLEDWKALKLHTEYVELLIRILLLRREGKDEEADKAKERFFDFMCRHEMDLQEVLDVDNMVRVWSWGYLD